MVGLPLVETVVGKFFRPACGREVLCRLTYETTWNAEQERWERRMLRLEEIEACADPVDACKEKR